MAKAVNAYKAELTKPEGSHRGLRPIADQFHISYGTLCNRVHRKRRSITEFAQICQRLFPAEERVLVDLAVNSADSGFLLTHELLASYANSILKV